MGGGWREREREREEVPLPVISSGRGYTSVPATNNDRKRDRNVGIAAVWGSARSILVWQARVMRAAEGAGIEASAKGG